MAYNVTNIKYKRPIHLVLNTKVSQITGTNKRSKNRCFCNSMAGVVCIKVKSICIKQHWNCILNNLPFFNHENNLSLLKTNLIWQEN